MSAPGDDLVRQFFRVTDIQAHLLGIAVGDLPQQILVALLPGALDNEAHRQGHQVIQDLLHQVDALALKKPGGHAQ